MSKARVVLCCLVLIAALVSPQAVTPAGAAYWEDGFTLNSNQSVSSGNYRLFMGSDGNLVLYRTNTSPWVAVWDAGTAGNPGARAVFQGDGNLVVYSSTWNDLWDSKTGGLGDTLVLSSDGNMSIFGTSSQLRWSTNTSQTPSGGTSVAGAAPFGWPLWWEADSSLHTHHTSETTAADRNEWQWRIDGPGGENQYEPTDLNFLKAGSLTSSTDFYWYVTPDAGLVNSGAYAEVDCQNPSGTTGICDRCVMRINSDEVGSLTSHMRNNLICHEISHTLGFQDGGTTQSSCITGGDNSRLGWWEVATINARY